MFPRSQGIASEYLLYSASKRRCKTYMRGRQKEGTVPVPNERNSETILLDDTCTSTRQGKDLLGDSA